MQVKTSTRTEDPKKQEILDKLSQLENWLTKKKRLSGRTGSCDEIL